MGIVPLNRSPIWRPEPPAEFTDAEKHTWNDTVEGMRDSWFSKATLPMLRGYCLIVKQADEIAAELRQLPGDCARARGLREQHAEVMKMMALIGTKLRICPSSNKSTKDGMRRDAAYPKPWELTERPSSTKKLWEADDGDAS
jgi:hypothetical protein